MARSGLGQVLSGPFAGAIFTDLGADVIKVENPEGGDDARQMGPAFRHGDALNFHEFNRGKRSATLDLKALEGVERLHALLAGADIMLHNLRPGAAEALGIGPEAVCARHVRRRPVLANASLPSSLPCASRHWRRDEGRPGLP